MSYENGLARLAPYTLTGSAMVGNPSGAVCLDRPTHTRGAHTDPCLDLRLRLRLREIE